MRAEACRTTSGGGLIRFRGRCWLAGDFRVDGSACASQIQLQSIDTLASIENVGSNTDFISYAVDANGQ